SSLQLTRQLAWSPEKKGQVWTAIISQKIQNQSNFLQKQSFTEKAESIQELHEGLLEFDPTNREGHAARIYFQTLFGTKFTREENNEINA
ncbi:subtype II CRISPR-associated endonuclease Cas1, partial [Bacillus thuringiensis]|nr:subtype II CRISPR-associated endonuclease Cas1 [Bacillus thuringiensis]